MMHYKKYYLGKFNTSNVELYDLLKSWLAIALAFSIAVTGFDFSMNFIIMFLVALTTVGIGFIFHELSHKIIAQKYHCMAEFRADNKMLIFAIILSFTGFIFAAPGAVLIHGHVSRKQNGQISAAGPIANLALAFIFVLIFFTIPSPIAKLVGTYGAMINTWLALFNLIPFSIFDGRKIMHWSKVVYGAMVIFCVLLFIFTQYLMY